MAVSVLELCRDELDGIVFHGFDGLSPYEVVHLHEPLHRKFGFYDGVGAFGMPYFVHIILDFLYKSLGFEVFHDLSAHVETVYADIHSSCFGDGSVVVEYVDGLKIVFVAEHIVVDVVGRGNLQASCAELHLNVFVHYDGYGSAHLRHDYALPFEPRVARVVGVDAYSRVAEDGLRAGGGHNDVPVLFPPPRNSGDRKACCAPLYI